jgi:tetratricopeptide (TPR) repeat protein
MPKPEDFSDNRNEIVPLLLKKFDQTDYAFLELLSFPNYWNYDVVKHLLKEFNPGVPLNQVTRFYEYSFIQEHGDDHITMQHFIRSWLQQQHIHSNHSKAFYIDVHQTLMAYYENRFYTSYKYEDFLEAAFHAEQAMANSDFEKWLQTQILILQNKGYTDGLIDYLQTFVHKENVSRELNAALHVTLLDNYLKTGHYQSIYQEYQDVLNKANDVEREDYRSNIQYIVASAHYAESHYEDAIKYYKLASATSQYPLLTIEALIKIGKISVTISDLESARTSYLQASQHVHRLMEQEHHSTELYHLAGQCYEKLGELMALLGKRDEQLRLYKQSIHFLHLAIKDEAHPNYLHHLTLLGFSTKRLAEAYEYHNGDVLGTFKEAIAIYENVLLAIPHSVDTLEKLGHASADALRLAISKKLHEEVLHIFEKANRAFSSVIELAPNQGSSLNRLSTIHLELAKYYMDAYKNSKAKLHLNEARRYQQLTIERAKNYAYAPAKKQAIDEAFARYERLTQA